MATFQIKSTDGQVLFEGEGESFKKVVEKAVLQRTNLQEADLQGAILQKTELREANL